MHRYYFDLVDPAGGRIIDLEGLEFDSLDAAKEDALHSLGPMAEAEPDDAVVLIEIRDDPNGPTLATVSLQTG